MAPKPHSFQGFDELKLESQEIRLIRIENHLQENTLHYRIWHANLDQAPVFYALSYCWGAPVAETALKTILLNGSSTKVRPNLYAFLKRAAVCMPHVWLWVDSLCIDQEDILGRNHQVSIMAKIYQSAELVYVWLGEDYDLAYVMEHIRNEVPQTQFHTATILDSVERLFQSSYWTRRWAMQEFALARQLVLASAEQEVV